MMEFNVIDFNNKELWEKIVKDKEIYYFWQYVDAFYKNGDGIPKLAYSEQENNEYVYKVFFIRNIAKDLQLNEKEYPYYDIITPYGYGGIDANSENKELIKFFFENYKEYCIKNNVVSEFIRLNPLLNNYKLYNDEYDIKNISKTVYMKLETPEQIWKDMEGRCRTAIRKAQKNNLKVKSGFNKVFLKEFINIYEETMNRDKANSYYFFNDAFFESILNNLQHFAKIYTVYYKDKAINSSIIIFNGNIV